MEQHRNQLAKVNSQQFQAAFERCWNTDKFYDIAPNTILGIPALICAALSVELGIKALLDENGIRPPREHDLRKLINKLPETIRLDIVDKVKESYEDFDSQLSNASKAFVQWRYFYESKEEINVNILFVGALGDAVQSQLGLNWEHVP